MKRCDFIKDVTPMPDASTNWQEPFMLWRTPCDRDAIVVQWKDGIVVKGYCEAHCDELNISKNPAPNSGWRKYSDAEFYGVFR